MCSVLLQEAHYNLWHGRFLRWNVKDPEHLPTHLEGSDARRVLSSIGIVDLSDCDAFDATTGEAVGIDIELVRQQLSA